MRTAVTREMGMKYGRQNKSEMEKWMERKCDTYMGQSKEF
jgi:hypothetical protein